MAKIDRQNGWRRRLYLPAYRIKSAARYAGIAPRTVTYWHHGGGSLGPALPGHERRKALSYFQLEEVAFVATFRKLGVSLQRLRRAHDYLSQVFEAEFPFAVLRLKTEGHHVLMDMEELEPDNEIKRLIIADAEGQVTWQPDVASRFEEFEYEHDIALRWHVAGSESKIIIDPRISFGAPQIKGTPTWAIRGRRIAGESKEEIADDFGLEVADVEEALRFEQVPLAA